MTRTKRCGAVTLLLISCLHATAAWGQMPGYAGGGYPPAAAANPPQLPLYATRQREFGIPFTVDRHVAQPVEVHLYVSVDQGRNWQLQSRQSPHAGQFLFRAAGDGEYWFASRTIDGAQHAQSQGAPQPEMRVVVDTVSPQLELTARPGEKGEVLCSWQSFDQNLLASSVKIEYQEGVGMPWRPVSVQLPHEDVVRTSYQGQVTFWPETRSPTITIRAELRDRAGNLAVANRRLLLPALVAQQTPTGAGLAPPPSDPFARYRQPSEGAVAWPSDNQAIHPGPGGGSQQWASNSPALPGALPQPPAMAGAGGFPLPNGQISAQQASTPYPPPASAMSGTPNSQPRTLLPNAVPPDSSSVATVPVNASREMSSSNTAGSNMVSPDAVRRDVESMLPPGEQPQMTNSPRFHLEYDVDAVGPSGVAEVQLWATADAGHTWRLWGTDDDLQSPFDVVVEQEGIFGFQVVVVGKNGMSGRRPRTGDPAGIWVGVDTTVPTAKLLSATYGEGVETGKLLIQWRAADQFLDPRPITLSFSESPDGPWTVIVSALQNSGQFAWPADPQLPSSVYLKLDVRDEAGNVASDQTEEPVSIDGLAPKARIRGVQPLRDADREAFRIPRRG